MKIKKVLIMLPEGAKYANICEFENSDDIILADIYKNWINLSNKLKAIGGRGVNLPETLSESIFCRALDCVRFTSSIPGVNTSFDVYDIKNRKRIQVKACSVQSDLTSFGPASVWDELYFMDFYVDGTNSGKVNIYLIPNEDIYNYKVNKSQTVRDQQNEGRRPRFSIKNIIELKNIQPIAQYQI